MPSQEEYDRMHDEMVAAGLIKPPESPDMTRAALDNLEQPGVVVGGSWLVAATLEQQKAKEATDGTHLPAGGKL